MEVSNRFLASFLIIFIIAIVFGTITVLEKLSGFAIQQQAQVSVTVAGICGDALVTGSEQCDGANLTGQTCITRGYDAGTLACYGNCSFDTSLCTRVAAANVTVANVTAAAAAGERPKTEGALPKIIYDPDVADTFDVAIPKTFPLFYILFKQKSYSVNVDELGDSVAVLKITREDNNEKQIINFEFGQTKPVDLDKDGILDLKFTLTDILTRRAVFHIEKIKQAESKLSLPVKQTPQQSRTEIPRFEIYNQDYIDAFLLLALVTLAILNFGLFKKFITSKK